MCPPLLGGEGEGNTNGPMLACSPNMKVIPKNSSGLKERNYLGLSDCSSVDSSTFSSLSDENKSKFNFKATELRLGLPGSQSPERQSKLCLLDEKPLFPLLPSKDGICSSSQKNVVSSNKRGFSDTMDGFSEVKNSVYNEGNWMLPAAGADSKSPESVGKGIFPVSSINVMLSSRTSGTQPTNLVTKSSKDQSKTKNGASQNVVGASHNSSAPASKAQVVGWPPIRSFRKNLTTTSKNNDEVDGKPSRGALFIKVSMDGAPYLRKVDLRTYGTYQELSSALEKMFSCFTIGEERLSESKLRDLLHGSEYVLTYEDKDGDWMLVGDVPWEMFIDSCKRLKIMKGSDAIGLAPRSMEKSKSRN